jgi:hypothetical protein
MNVHTMLSPDACEYYEGTQVAVIVSTNETEWVVGRVKWSELGEIYFIETATGFIDMTDIVAVIPLPSEV